MKIIILGMGYVGLTSAACLLKDGHSVVGIDVNGNKVKDLKSGVCPIYEPGIEELLNEGVSDNRFNASTTIGSELIDADLVLVCVGTPSLPDGSHNLSYIASSSRDVVTALVSHSRSRPEKLVVSYRSTIRPGTMENLVKPIFDRGLEKVETSVSLVYNPEFLREASAISDYFNPPKIVIGTENGEGSEVMNKLYKSIESPRFNVKFKEAEITKFVDNSFHAVKVSFANEIGRICNKLDISASTVHQIFVSDTKLNISKYYLRPGGAFGGSCLPKDVRALVHISGDVGASTHLIDSLMRTNSDHKRFQFEEIVKNLSGGASILMNGIAFKDKSDDLRESPYVDLALMIVRAGFDLKIFDPYVDPDALIGANLGHQLSTLPNLSDLLISIEDIESSSGFDRVVDCRGSAGDLRVVSGSVINVNTMN